MAANGTANVVVVGGGIGGLTAAIALQQAGCSVEVYERAPALKPIGAGLTVQPNAVLALRRLGLGDAVERAGQVLRATGALARADGTLLNQLGDEEGAALIAEVGAP